MGTVKVDLRFAIIILIVVLGAATAWAVRWQYVTVATGTAGDPGQGSDVLLRFNRFTGAGEVYACRSTQQPQPSSWSGFVYWRITDTECTWVRR